MRLTFKTAMPIEPDSHPAVLAPPQPFGRELSVSCESERMPDIAMTSIPLAVFLRSRLIRIEQPRDRPARVQRKHLWGLPKDCAGRIFAPRDLAVSWIGPFRLKTLGRETGMGQGNN